MLVPLVVFLAIEKTCTDEHWMRLAVRDNEAAFKETALHGSPLLGASATTLSECWRSRQNAWQ